jgi:hypothetical protein
MPLTYANAERNTSRWLRRAIPVRFGECKRMLDMITLGRQRQSLPVKSLRTRRWNPRSSARPNWDLTGDLFRVRDKYRAQ